MMDSYLLTLRDLCLLSDRIEYAVTCVFSFVSDMMCAGDVPIPDFQNKALRAEKNIEKTKVTSVDPSLKDSIGT